MSKFGAYEILHELERGGMGAVLLGRRKGPGSFEQLVAIKTIRSEYASTEAVRAMFLDEAKILGGINHPAIATVHDFGEEAGTLYMVMEYVAGISFRSVLDLKMPPGVAARAIAEACRGVHAAHEVRDTAGNVLNVVHRDISPDNLLLGFDGHVKVIDFGIALIKNRQSPVTEFGTVKGKPPYMSPEQVKNEALDRRSDVFSLGVVLHELLTGELLFDGESIYAIARKVEHAEIRPPSAIRGPLPPGLDAAVMRALDRDLAHRTPTAAAFAEQLEQAISAAGDETLEAWSEHTLAGVREQHRAWLAGIVAGRDTPRPMGRATGSVTAMGPLAFVDQLPIVVTPARPPEHETPAAPSASTDVPAEDGRPRRRLAGPLVLALVLALAIGAAILFFGRSRVPTVHDAAVATVDASADTVVVALADAHVEIDAAIAELDAAVVIVDAAPPRRIDAAIRMPVDAASPPPPADAAVAQGTGWLIVKHHVSTSTYLDVYVAGRHLGRTPVLNPVPLPAGTHPIVMIEPEHNKTVHTGQVTIADGETKTYWQPKP